MRGEKNDSKGRNVDSVPIHVRSYGSGGGKRGVVEPAAHPDACARKHGPRPSPADAPPSPPPRHPRAKRYRHASLHYQALTVSH